MTARSAPFPWFGGKARLAPYVVDLMPPHAVYVEPFGGAASVLFSKRRVQLEVYNDVHRGLVTFFRVLRDRPDELARVLRLTPYSRDEYEAAIDAWEDATDELELARLWFVCAAQSFTAAPGRQPSWAYQRNARSISNPLGTGRVRARSFKSAIDELDRFAERLRGVQVDHRDWREILDLYDGPTALFYLDPPYHPDVRARGCEYGAHEMTAADHDELVSRIQALTGAVLLSGYAHHSYDPLADAGFERFEIQHYKVAGVMRGRARAKVTEVLWRRAPGAHAQQSLLADGAAA